MDCPPRGCETNGLTDTPPPADAAASPLDLDFYLVKIFKHLLDYGLQDCRLVCRKWYAVCQLFPLKLRNVSFENLDALARGFPNTISLTAEPSYWDDDLNDCARQLAAFPNLQRVRWTMRDLWNSRRTGPIFAPLHKLKHLDLTLAFSSLSIEAYSSLRFLTGLTKLSLDGCKDAFEAEERNVEPFAELTEIRELRIPSRLFVDQKGMSRFPSLTNLTELDLYPESWGTPLHNAVFEVIGSYASTLQALHVWLPSSSSRVNYASLLWLERLRTLGVRGDFTVYRTSFLEVLQKMDFLQNLSIQGRSLLGNWIALENLDSIFACSSLKSLELGICNRVQNGPIGPADALRQLTKLVTPIVRSMSEMLLSIPQLLHLELVVLCEWSAEMNEALDSLTALRSLSIMGDRCVRTPVLSSKTLGGLTQLESLSLERVSVDKLLFQELASLTRLTTLRIKNCAEGWPPSLFLSKINVMSTLEELELWLPTECRIASYLSPRCLPKLERIILGGSDRMVPLLRKKFAVKPQLRVNPHPSLWCSPGSDD